jgi:DnaJ-domain-containing protein 1
MATAQDIRKIGRSTLRHATDDTKTLAKDVFKLNKEQNALKREHDKKRRELYAVQKAEGITTFTCDAIVDGKKVTIESTIATPQRQTVDVELLRDLVDEATFMKIVSATQKSVVDEAGKAVFDRCAKTVDGTEAVNVKAAK